MRKILLILLCFSSCTVIKTVSDSVDQQEFEMLAKENNKVFIASNHKFISEKIVNYTKKEIDKWGYWTIANKEKDSDFILEIDMLESPGLAVINISANFINTNNKKSFKSVKVKPWGFNFVFNTTKWSVKKIIKKRIKPFVKSTD